LGDVHNGPRGLLHVPHVTGGRDRTSHVPPRVWRGGRKRRKVFGVHLERRDLPFRAPKLTGLSKVDGFVNLPRAQHVNLRGVREPEPHGGVRGVRSPYILGYYVTDFAPHLAQMSIARGMLTLDEKVELHLSPKIDNLQKLAFDCGLNGLSWAPWLSVDAPTTGVPRA